MNVDGSYKTYLHKLATYLDNTNKQFSFLIHEGKDDYELAKEIVIESKIKVNIIWESDPLLIKCLIKSSKFIITSRYHGLINGLSQGIPSLSTSWSHKYETLLAEYEFTSGLISDLSDFSNTIEKINMIEDNYVEIKKGIEKKSVIHKNKLDDMWNKVVNIINH